MKIKIKVLNRSSSKVQNGSDAKISVGEKKSRVLQRPVINEKYKRAGQSIEG